MENIAMSMIGQATRTAEKTVISLLRKEEGGLIIRGVFNLKISTNATQWTCRCTQFTGHILVFIHCIQFNFSIFGISRINSTDEIGKRCELGVPRNNTFSFH